MSVLNGLLMALGALLAALLLALVISTAVDCILRWLRPRPGDVVRLHLTSDLGVVVDTKGLFWTDGFFIPVRFFSEPCTVKTVWHGHLKIIKRHRRWLTKRD